MVAVISLAARVGGSSSDAAVGLVMSARMIPGIFLAPVGGVLVDRWDRKPVMVTCDIGRGLVLLMLPFVDTLPALFLASLLLEIMTLLWSPAKEASVPNMVAADKLTSANSLSLAAAYGTFPVGSAVFALLAKVAETLTHNHALHAMRLDRRETLAIDADVLTFFCSAVLISTLALPRRARAVGGRVTFAQTFTELRDGLRFIATSPVVRAVIVGIGTGLVGGAMVVPLGPTFSIKVLHAGPAGFGLLLTALRTGAGIGGLGLSTIQPRVRRQQLFPLADVAAGEP